MIPGGVCASWTWKPGLGQSAQRRAAAAAHSCATSHNQQHSTGGACYALEYATGYNNVPCGTWLRPRDSRLPEAASRNPSSNDILAAGGSGIPATEGAKCEDSRSRTPIAFPSRGQNALRSLGVTRIGGGTASLLRSRCCHSSYSLEGSDRTNCPNHHSAS